MVEVRQPYFLGKGGTNPEPFPTGRHFIWPSSTTFGYNIKPFMEKEQFNDITASDNVPIDFGTTFVFRQVAGKTPGIHSGFGSGWYKSKVRAKFRTITRNEARGRTSVGLRTDKAVIEGSQTNILIAGNEFLKDVGLNVVLEQVQIGHVVPPEQLLTEAARTAAQKQRKKTQDARKLAEDARKEAEESSAIADNAYMAKMGMTPDQYLRSRQLDILEKAEDAGTAKFNVWLTSGGQAPQPVIDVTK
ncbi:hypothetical protein DRN34_02750 [Thermococci archaeon]|nr:MAG: hypothetical protein DRN34_02750 [Thermococci archaeon]